MQEMNNAPTELGKRAIEEKIKAQLSSLSESEKEQIKNDFLESLDSKLIETKKALDVIDLRIELLEVAQYVSLSKIAKNYFGKSKEWLYQRINGYTVNGKAAEFTPTDRVKLSNALQDISRKLNETSLKIA